MKKRIWLSMAVMAIFVGLFILGTQAAVSASDSSRSRSADPIRSTKSWRPACVKWTQSP